MKRLLSVILVVLVILNCSMVAYAEESQATEDSPVAVTTLEELQAAIAAAADGDTIFIASTIIIESDCTIGLADKKITLVAAEGIQGNLIKVRGATVNFLGVTIDGSNGFCTSTVINSGNAELDFQNCTFQRNKAIVVYVEQSTKLSFVSCLMQNNSQILSMRGIGSIEMDNCIIKENNANITCLSIAGEASISNCQFLNNTIATEGGVLSFISSHASRINSCQFVGNRSSSGSGAAISTGGNTTISNCFFNGNEAGIAGNDIFVQEYGTLNILDTDEQLASLYSAHGVQYNGTFIDAKYERYNDVSSPKRIELPATNYVGALCFVSEEIPATEPDESTEPTDPPEVNIPTVSSYEELIAAINQVEDGGTIQIADTIYVRNGGTIGSDEKQMTLIRNDGFSGYMLYTENRDGTDLTIKGLTFDGQNESSTMVVLDSACTFSNCQFVNSLSAATSFGNGIPTFDNCQFSGNGIIITTSVLYMSNCQITENSGSVYCIDLSGSASLENCTFTNNEYSNDSGSGGVIRMSPSAQAVFSDCSFTGNKNYGNGFGNGGGVVSNSGNLTLKSCFFLDNVSDWAGADISCYGTGIVTIENSHEELETLYKSHGRTFLGVYQDNLNNRYSADNQTEKLSLPLTENQNSICFASELLSVPEETTPPPAPSESEETEPTTPTVPTPPPEETLPDGTEETDPPVGDDATETSPSVDDDAADTEPTIPENTDPPEDEPTNPPETEDSMVEETTDNQDRTQYIYYIPQTPATANTEPTATEESTTETTQGVTEQQNPYTGDTPVFAPEATGTPQEGASGEDEIDIALRELRVLVGILLVAEVLQFACFIIIWGLPMLKGIYKGRYKRRM